MRRVVLVVVCSLGFMACAQVERRKATWSEDECDERYEALSDEYQGEVSAWQASVVAAKGTPQLAEVQAQGFELRPRYLPRFQELAAHGCGRAKVHVLDSLGAAVPPDEAQVAYALGLLEDLVHVHTDAWWISDLGDNEVLRYFLSTSGRVRAIELFTGFIERTSDEDARREVLFQLGHGLILMPGEPADRVAALAMLERVAQTWPESGRAANARGILRIEQDLLVGARMPALEGQDVDGHRLRLRDFSGRVVVIDFFGFWCKPCKEGLPALAELIAHYSEEDFAVLGVDAFDDEATFRAGRESFEVTWPCIFDGARAPLSQSLGVSAFPAVFVLDREGVIRSRNPSEEELKSIVASLVRGK